MLTAHVEGIVDFSQAQLFSRKWNQKLAWTLDYLGRKKQLEIYQLDYLQHAGGLHNNYKHHWKELGWLRNSAISVIMPWRPKGPTSSEEAAEMLSEEYVKLIGDPNDPVYAEKMRRQIEAWENQNARKGR